MKIYLAILLSMLAHGAQALTLTCLGPDRLASGVAFAPTHIIEVSGKIEAGDFVHFKAELERIKNSHPVCSIPPRRTTPTYFGHYILSLNSMGGSLVEALDIANFVSDRYISTRVPDGAECLSSCGLIFMAGMMSVGDGYRMPSRQMGLAARVGFHSPFLDGVDFSQIPSEILPTVAADTYDAAIAASSRLIALAIKSRWKAGFVNVLLQTPSNSLNYIDTIGKMGDWGVTPIGLELPPNASDATLRAACVNLHFWADEDAGVDINFDAKLDPYKPWPPTRAEFDALFFSEDIFARRTPMPNNPTAEEVSFSVDFGDFSCTLRVDRHGDKIQIRNLYGSFEPFFVIPAYVALDEAAEYAATIEPETDAFERLAVYDNRVWDHNGSVMRSRVTGDEITIVYEKPRAALARAAVFEGTLLFVGHLIGDEIKGNATLFSSKGCMPLKYQVSGPVDDIVSGSIVLRGAVPIRGNNCRVSGTKTTGGNANLGFTLLQ